MRRVEQVALFLVTHTHKKEFYDGKMIGLYLTRLAAGEAIDRLRKLPGFRDWPDHFEITEYVVDKDYWTDGWFTVD